MSASPSENFRPAPTGERPLVVAFLVCFAASLVSHFASPNYAASLVAFVFLVTTYALCLRRGSPDAPAHFGLAFGGLFDDAPLDARRIARALVSSFGIALVPALLIFPFFVLAFPIYHRVDAFSVSVALARITKDSSLFDLVLAQIFVVALPEEAFFRGYLQTRLDENPKVLLSLFGLELTLGNIVTSVLFSLGHFATIPHPARLAVFFPSLVFGLLRRKSESIGPAIIFHATSNLLSTALAAGYGF